MKDGRSIKLDVVPAGGGGRVKPAAQVRITLTFRHWQGKNVAPIGRRD